LERSSDSNSRKKSAFPQKACGSEGLDNLFDTPLSSAFIARSSCGMLRSWKIGSAFGIPLYIHPSFLLLPLLLVINQYELGWQQVLAGEALLFVVFTCVILHELGHALTARRFGTRPVDITLYPIGGVARLSRLAQSPVEELVTAVAGPAVNVVIALLLTPLWIGLAYWAEARGDEPFGNGLLLTPEAFVFAVWMSNLVLVFFNMMPTFPMDGGRVLRAALSHWFGLVRATEIAVFTGRILIGLLLGLILIFVPELLLQNMMLLVVAGFVLFAGWRELRFIRRLQQEAEREAELEAELEDELEPEDAVPSMPGYANLLLRRSPTPGYSGFTWDAEARVCVHWIKGQPVGVFFVPLAQQKT